MMKFAESVEFYCLKGYLIFTILHRQTVPCSNTVWALFKVCKTLPTGQLRNYIINTVSKQCI